MVPLIEFHHLSICDCEPVAAAVWGIVSARGAGTSPSALETISGGAASLSVNGWVHRNVGPFPLRRHLNWWVPLSGPIGDRQTGWGDDHFPPKDNKNTQG